MFSNARGTGSSYGFMPSILNNQIYTNLLYTNGMYQNTNVVRSSGYNALTYSMTFLPDSIIGAISMYYNRCDYAQFYSPNSNITNLHYTYWNSSLMVSEDIANNFYLPKNCTCLEGAFGYCKFLNLNSNVYISEIVDNCRCMFSNCQNIIDVRLIIANSEKRINAECMFSYCINFNSMGDTILNYTRFFNYSNMFVNCTNLTNKIIIFGEYGIDNTTVNTLGYVVSNYIVNQNLSFVLKDKNLNKVSRFIDSIWLNGSNQRNYNLKIYTYNVNVFTHINNFFVGGNQTNYMKLKRYDVNDYVVWQANLSDDSTQSNGIWIYNLYNDKYAYYRSL